jgi:hypothetical protein
MERSEDVGFGINGEIWFYGGGGRFSVSTLPWSKSSYEEKGPQCLTEK